MNLPRVETGSSSHPHSRVTSHDLVIEGKLTIPAEVINILHVHQTISIFPRMPRPGIILSGAEKTEEWCWPPFSSACTRPPSLESWAAAGCRNGGSFALAASGQDNGGSYNRLTQFMQLQVFCS